MSLASDPAREIVVSRLLDAPRELVFSMWTKAEHLTRWWGPEGFSTTTHELDFRPGGSWRFTMHVPDGSNFPAVIKFQSVEIGRIEYDHEDLSGTVLFKSTVDLAEQEGRTLMTITTLFPTSVERDRLIREVGWDQGLKLTLDRLNQYLTSLLEANK